MSYNTIVPNLPVLANHYCRIIIRTLVESLADQVFAKIIASGFFISITHFANNEVNQEQSRKRKHGTEQNLTAESARRIQMVQRSMLLTENNYSVVTCRSGMGLTMSLKPRVCLTFNE